MRAFLSAHHCCAQAWLLSCCHLYQLWTHKKHLKLNNAKNTCRLATYIPWLFYLAQAKGEGPSLKSVLVPFFFFYISFKVGVANRHSRGTDWSQVSNLEMLIGLRALYSDHVLLHTLFSVGEARNCGFDLPGRSVPPYVDSDKLRN